MARDWFEQFDWLLWDYHRTVQEVELKRVSQDKLLEKRKAISDYVRKGMKQTAVQPGDTQRLRDTMSRNIVAMKKFLDLLSEARQSILVTRSPEKLDELLSTLDSHEESMKKIVSELRSRLREFGGPITPGV